QAWEEYEELAAGKTGFSPAFHSPHRWREYCETLLRYEQLLRAGDPTGKAAGLHERLRNQRGQMLKAEQDLQAKLLCVSNALPLPFTFGRKPLPEAEVGKRFDALWLEEPGRRLDRWKETRDWAKAAGSLDLLRIRVGDLLLAKAIEDPAKNLKAVHELAQVIYDANSPPPVEIHFASLLDRDVGQLLPEKVTLVKSALNRERQAEAVALAAQQPDGARSAGTFHPYSEWVYSWISSDVADGDKQRRFGNDLLVSSKSSNADLKNSEYFKSAEDCYQSAAEIAKAVRDALTARDIALAELPVFTRYVGRRDGAHGVDDAEIKAIESLWTRTFELADLLDLPDPAKPAKGRGDMEKFTRELRAGLEDQRKKYHDACVNDEFLLEYLPTNWRAIEELLSVPYLLPNGNGAALRMTLLKNSRKISDGLNTKTNQKGSMVGTPLTAGDRGKRQGRLVLAMLGKKWVDDQAIAHPESMQKYDDLHRSTEREGSGWEATLNRAGEQIGDCWRRMPERIQEHVKKSLTVDAKEAEPELHGADSLARQMDAAGAARLSVNPADEYRRLRLQGLLLWLADRTVHDHWWSENNDVDPFYLRAGQAFLNDSKQIALSPALAELPEQQRNKRLDSEKARQLESVLKKQGLDVKQLFDVSWTSTSDPSIVLSYRVKAPVALRPGLPGLPMARLKPNPRLELVDPDKQGWTVVDQFDEQKPEAFLNYRVRLTDKRDEDVNAELEVLYRGELINLKTPIRLFRKPDTIVRQHEVPNTGAFTTRIDENAYQGSLVIILDASGSMRTVDADP
ncbi:MAG TPA: hypothetical protein VGG61_09155, partial [Gemmataceae bacterium]